MAIYNLGSINADYFYRVPHIVAEGETLSAKSMSSGLGGKGANQSVAAARAGAEVFHIGAVGPDGAWAVDRLAEAGVDTTSIRRTETPTAHAIISVADDGENAIVIFSGANMEQTSEALEEAMSTAKPGDLLILQNETSHQSEAAKIAKDNGLTVVYSAAPFDVVAVRSILDHVDVLVMNEVEAQQLIDATGQALSDLPVSEVLITLGAQGAEWRNLKTGQSHKTAAFKVDPVDTTGAGDTFLGYYAAARDEGKATAEAMTFASAASAIMVTRHGTADVIPTRDEVEQFIAQSQ